MSGKGQYHDFKNNVTHCTTSNWPRTLGVTVAAKDKNAIIVKVF